MQEETIFCCCRRACGFSSKNNPGLRLFLVKKKKKKLFSRGGLNIWISSYLYEHEMSSLAKLARTKEISFQLKIHTEVLVLYLRIEYWLFFKIYF
jgi:hypothetical protein